jgi:hypothetical protein
LYLPECKAISAPIGNRVMTTRNLSQVHALFGGMFMSLQ